MLQLQVRNVSLVGKNIPVHQIVVHHCPEDCEFRISHVQVPGVLVGVVWYQQTVADSLKDCTQPANTRQ